MIHFFSKFSKFSSLPLTPSDWKKEEEEFSSLIISLVAPSAISFIKIQTPLPFINYYYNYAFFSPKKKDKKHYLPTPPPFYESWCVCSVFLYSERKMINLNSAPSPCTLYFLYSPHPPSTTKKKKWIEKKKKKNIVNLFLPTNF